MGRRVVITGLGALTPLGNDVETFWQGLVEGRSGVAPIAMYDASDQAVRIAAEIKDFDPERYLSRRRIKRTNRFSQMILIAAQQAVEDAAISFSENGSNRHAGAIIGTGIGGIETLIDCLDVMASRGASRVSALMIPMMMPNAGAGEVAIRYGLHGPALAVSSACATGNNAIGEAAQRIRLGMADVMLAGSGESTMHPITLAALSNMRAVSHRNDEPEAASRPFDANRDGFVMGEGAAVLVLESMEHAQKRGARIYAEVTGYGVSCDAFHITAPDTDGVGAALSMQLAIEEAGLAPNEIEYINAHGTSTPLNDPIETRAIRSLFGDYAYRVPVSSTKSMIGHLMGAAGSVEAIACIKSIETGIVHPTINYETPDPECDLDYVPNSARQVNPRTVLSNSFGFGGHNATLVFQRFED
jgi:3-oxoacyl-[acyl-carrier-protein] synthase II